jgi:hypothetical protein
VTTTQQSINELEDRYHKWSSTREHMACSPDREAAITEGLQIVCDALDLCNKLWDQHIELLEYKHMYDSVSK